MIIISQDKDLIVNFANIVSIWINSPLENDYGEFEILAESNSVCETLGVYKTEERAKEILESITCMFGADSINNSTYELADMTMKLKHLKIFRMPLE